MAGFRNATEYNVHLTHFFGPVSNETLVWHKAFSAKPRLEKEAVISQLTRLSALLISAEQDDSFTHVRGSWLKIQPIEPEPKRYVKSVDELCVMGGCALGAITLKSNIPIYYNPVVDSPLVPILDLSREFPVLLLHVKYSFLKKQFGATSTLAESSKYVSLTTLLIELNDEYEWTLGEVADLLLTMAGRPEDYFYMRELK